MRTILKTAGLAGGLAALAWTGAFANDSTAELATGGLVLTKSAAIEMRSEDLYISAKQIRVHYRFLNTSAHDETITVAFPMPDITTQGVDDMIAIPTEDPVNILGFHTLVDGKPVAAQVEQKAIKDGVDRTGWLKAHGIPLAPHLQSTNKLLDMLPQNLKDEMVKLGLAVIDEYDIGDGHGMVKHLDATWTLKTTYFWRQTFPAGRELDVQHSYTPSLGESAGTLWGDADAKTRSDNKADLKRFCIDDQFLAAAAKTRKPGEMEAPFTEQRVEYILKSGANWKSPIADFRMVIDKGDAKNLVSFCGEGVKKISPTQFEVHRTNFLPTSDVSVLILLPLPNS